MYCIYLVPYEEGIYRQCLLPILIMFIDIHVHVLKYAQNQKSVKSFIK